MAATFDLHIRALDRDYYEGACVSLTVPLADGQLGILARHVPVAAAVVPGTLTCRLADGRTLAAVCGSGLLRFADNDALLLLDSVEDAGEIDAARARAAEERAKKALSESRTEQERTRAADDLRRAKNRLRAAERRE